MKRLLLVALVGSLVFGLPLILAAGGGDAKAGKAVYAKRCASCHGPNGEGNPGIAKAMKVELRDLGSKEVQAKSDEELRKESIDGVGKMKPVKGLTDEEVKNMMAFLRSLAKK